jgi:hypothetical protein
MWTPWDRWTTSSLRARWMSRCRRAPPLSSVSTSRPLWQSVNTSADFPFSGAIMQAVFAQVERVHVDGVIALDVPALASLLTLTVPCQFLTSRVPYPLRTSRQ